MFQLPNVNFNNNWSKQSFSLANAENKKYIYQKVSVVNSKKPCELTHIWLDFLKLFLSVFLTQRGEVGAVMVLRLFGNDESWTSVY